MSTKSQPKPKKSPVTEIAFILDQSGSMGGHQEAAIAGFNDFLREQQDTTGKARLTLVLFDDQYEVPIDNIPVSEAVGLNSDTYTPRGTTALLDALGMVRLGEGDPGLSARQNERDLGATDSVPSKVLAGPARSAQRDLEGFPGRLRNASGQSPGWTPSIPPIRSGLTFPLEKAKSYQ